MSGSPQATAIVIESCDACGARWVLGRERCPHCGATEVTRLPASGRGRVFAATLVQRAPDESFKALLPYRIALVDLEEGPRLMAHLADAAPIGAPVEGTVRQVAGRPVPVFARHNDTDGQEEA